MISFKQYGGKGGGKTADIVKYYTGEKEYSPEFKAILEAEREKSGIASYYAPDALHERDRMQWRGGACAALGVDAGSAVEAEELGRLLDGYHAKTGKAQVANAGDEERRKGQDFTYSAPKSVDIWLDTLPDHEREKAIDRIQAEAVEPALNWLFRNSEVRKGAGGKEHHQAAGVCYALKYEGTNREGEPGGHWHAVKIAMNLGPDGKVSAAEEKRLQADRFTADKLATAGIFKIAREMGYGMEQEIEKDAFGRAKMEAPILRINGINREQELAVSTRQKQIDEAVAESGGKLSRQDACLRTREGKTERPYLEGLANSRALLKERGIEAPAQGLGDRIAWEPKTEEEFLRPLYEKSARVSERDLLKHIAAWKGHELGIEGVFAEARRLEREGHIQAREMDERGQVAFSPTYLIDIEKDFRRGCIARRDDPTCKIKDEKLEAAIAAHEKDQSRKSGRPFNLESDQLAVVKYACQETGGVCVINGKPGAGKTASIGAVMKAHAMDGRPVLGVSTSQQASEVLKNDTGGIAETYNAAALLARLDNGTMTMPGGALLVFDESGMGSLEQVARLKHYLDHAKDERGRAGKLVLLGDGQQHAPVGAGNPHKAAQEEIGFIDAGRIRRQKDPAQLEIANMLSAPAHEVTGEAIAAKMKESGRLVAIGEEGETAPACQELARRYMDGTYQGQDGKAKVAPVSERLIICDQHARIREINEAIHDARKEAGELAGAKDRNGIEMETSFPRLLRGAGTNQRTGTKESEVLIGERLTFTKNIKATDAEREKGKWNLEGKGVSHGEAINGAAGTVVGISDHYTNAKGVRVNEPTIRLDLDDGGSVEFQPRLNKAWDYGYCNTSHAAQGKTVNVSWELAPEPGEGKRNAALVNSTRARYCHTVIGSPEQVEGYGKTCGSFSVKDSALTREEIQSTRAEAGAPQVSLISAFQAERLERTAQRQQEQSQARQGQNREAVKALEQQPRRSQGMER